jgi:hypothetical protein
MSKRVASRLELANNNMPFTNVPFTPTAARITRGNAVTGNGGMHMSGSMFGSGPAPAGVVSNILASAWGGGNDNKYEFDYLTGWHNIHGRHNGVTLVAESQRLTEQVVNARGAIFLALTAPPLLTNEMYITIARSEPYIIPLDMMGMQGTPYESGRSASQETYGLASWKGMESITSEYLRDFYFGREALAELSYVLGRRMLVTLVDNVACALIDVPWQNAVKKFNHLQLGNYISYYVGLEGIMFAGVNKNPKRALNMILRQRTMRRALDRIAVAENQAHKFKEALELPKNLAYYLLAYDDPTGAVISAMFDNGPLGVGTIQEGQGEGLSVIQVPTQISSSADNEEDGVQRLRTYPVIGEMIQERFDVSVQAATGNTLDVDVRTWASTLTETTHPLLTHDAGLKYGGLFNTFDVAEGGPVGPNPEGQGPAFGREYEILVKKYAANRTIVEYLAHPNPQDNNTPPSGSSNAKTIRDLDFRKVYPIVGVYGPKDAYTLGVPRRVGDVSLRGMHPSTLKDAALKIDKVLRGVRDDDERQTKLWEQVQGPRHVDEDGYLGRRAPLDAMDIDAPIQGNPTQDAQLLSRVNSFQDLTPQVIGQLSRGPDSFVEHARIVPDSHMDQFLAFYKAGLAQGAPAAENFKKRLLELQSLKNQNNLIAALTQASAKLAAGTPIAEWSTPLVSNADRKDKTPLANASFSFDTALKASTTSSTVFQAKKSVFGAYPTDGGVVARGMDEGARALHVAKAMQMGLNEDQLAIYGWLLTLKFNYHTLTRLYQTFGVTLVNVNRYRNRQYYQMSAISGFIANQSYLTMFTHPQARSGVNPVQGMVYQTIEFRSSVIPLDPESTIIFPYAFCDRLINEINCRPAQTREQATSVDADAPSIWCTIVPKDETAYDFPLSLTGLDIHERKPRSKKSDTDLIKVLFGDQYLLQNGTTRKSPVVYARNGIFADIIHRSWKRVYDDLTEEWVNVNGTGPREESFVNSCEGHNIWAGVEPAFPVTKDVLQFSHTSEVVV